MRCGPPSSRAAPCPRADFAPLRAEAGLVVTVITIIIVHYYHYQY